MLKKGQAAIEYLTTYGWTIMIILITIGVLIYFNAFDPMQFVPDSCDFGDQIVCQDFFIDEAGTVRLLLLNAFSKDIIIHDATSVEFPLSNPCTPVTIPSGQSLEFTCDVATMTYGEGDKVRVDVVLEFSQDIGGAPHHFIRGTFVTEIEP